MAVCHYRSRGLLHEGIDQNYSIKNLKPFTFLPVTRTRIFARTEPNLSALSTICSATAIQVETPVVKSAPISLGKNKSIWSASSGQKGSPCYGAPLKGRAEPLGPSIDNETGAINFALFSSGAIAISLVLFNEEDLKKGKVTYEIPLDPELNRTGDTWHIMLPQLDRSLLYGYRVNGAHQEIEAEAAGHRFEKDKVMLDPYGPAVISRRTYGKLAPELPWKTDGILGAAATWPQAACSLPWPHSEFDWQGDRPLNLPMQDLVIYEMHVRGFTQDKSSGVTAPGTYAGMVERLDYLASLGVNAIELMPVFEFNELEYYSPIAGTDQYRFNYWGYSSVSYFAPMSRFSAAAAQGLDGRAIADEFKTLVREAHARGMEVIVDVVFNHTAEGDERGLALSFRGLDNRVYYMLAPAGQYYNYSGCGNTLNCNHPVVRRFILDCLQYWVTEYHIDGFRFDLASIMTRAHSLWHPTARGPDGSPLPMHSGAVIDHTAGLMTNGAGVPTGTPLSNPSLVESLSEDPILRNTKLIAEAWDCDGLNQVGAFPHYGRWSEWNGHFRDTVRAFIKGSDGPWAGAFASAMCGSPNIYGTEQPGEDDWWGNNGGRQWRGRRGPTASINFVSAHDGFTLADLVSYNTKHNEANGEENRDGENHNLSWNCGEEGASSKLNVLVLRQRQMRNFYVALLLAHGVPMICMGDEYGHSKQGNNNTYCHDSPLNWFDWSAAREDEAGLLRFVKLVIRLRQRRPELRRSTYVTDADIQWHGDLPFTPDWTEASRLVAYSTNDGVGGGLYVAFNTAHYPRILTLPPRPGRVWVPIIDTSKPAPYDFLDDDSSDPRSSTAAASAREMASSWLLDGLVAVLAWSVVVMESVPAEPAPARLTAAKAQ